ncbi:MAG: biopolymer transporter ExbD [Xanthomonadaceae bacterium]|nr:biopolymer transporter ExbD [Xanthomonadaceae bacterium]
MQRRTRRTKLNSEMNIVPYVDVMFVLLIIFMVTATTISVGIDVDPPSMESAKDVASEDNDDIVVSVDREGRFYLNYAPEPEVSLSDAQIKEQVRFVFDKNARLNTRVKGDKEAPYGRIIDAVALLQDVTEKKVQFDVIISEN